MRTVSIWVSPPTSIPLSTPYSSPQRYVFCTTYSILSKIIGTHLSITALSKPIKVKETPSKNSEASASLTPPEKLVKPTKKTPKEVVDNDDEASDHSDTPPKMLSKKPSKKASSEKNISVWGERLCQSGRAPSEASETGRWWITPQPVSRPRVALHIALQSLFHRFFSLCRSPILNKHSGVGANCYHMSEWVHWVHACIWIEMGWVTLRKSLLAFILPLSKMQFSLY
jgi:hypothetical protein